MDERRTMSATFLDYYDRQIAGNQLKKDPTQRQIAAAITGLEARLSTYQPPGNSLFSSLFGPKKQITSSPKGLYLYGGVGRGKTMLMDMFYDHTGFAPKARYHFNEFMGRAHDQIAVLRKSLEGDPIPEVAAILAKEAKLLCFDEFYVTDIADAMILGRLFTALYKEGVVIIATSNCPPDDLYKDGLNRQLFLPFIDLFKERMEIHEVTTTTDYRQRELQGKELYFAPLSGEADAAVCSLWQRITGQGEGKAARIIVKGRTLTVPETAGGAARFTFADLCGQPLGRDDYLALSERYHTIFIDDIPVLKPDRRDQARRFITLIDTLYDRQIRLIATAEAEPEALYNHGDNADLFIRTSSRLTEMRRGAHISEAEAASQS